MWQTNTLSYIPYKDKRPGKKSIHHPEGGSYYPAKGLKLVRIDEKTVIEVSNNITDEAARKKFMERFAPQEK